MSFQCLCSKWDTTGVKWMNGSPWAQENSMLKVTSVTLKNHVLEYYRGEVGESSFCKAHSCEFLQDPEQDLALLLLKWWLVGPWQVKHWSLRPSTHSPRAGDFRPTQLPSLGSQNYHLQRQAGGAGWWWAPLEEANSPFTSPGLVKSLNDRIRT